MPIGILGSLLICTVLYMLMSLVITGIAPYQILNVREPVSLAVTTAGSGLAWLVPFVNVGATIGLGTVVLVLLLGQSRIFYAMARDGMLPPVFSAIHPKFRTPYKATIIIGSFATLLAAFLPHDLLIEMVSIGTLLAFVIVCLSVLVLRRTHPNVPRPFRVKFMPFIPIAGIVVCGAMMIGLPFDTWLRLIIWLAIGLVIYFFYARHHAAALLRAEQGLSLLHVFLNRSGRPMSDITDLTQPNPATADEHELNRVLGPVPLILLGIGGVIGAGIFVITGTAAAEHAGPAVLISFVIAALGCTFAGLCYAEFAAMIPESGSAYTYSYATLGRFMAWFIGWNLVLEYLVSGAAVAAGWSGYFQALLADMGMHLPAAIGNAPLTFNAGHQIVFTGALINLPAAGLILVLTACSPSARAKVPRSTG